MSQKTSFFTSIASAVASAFRSKTADEPKVPANLTEELSAPVPLTTDYMVMSGTVGIRRAIDDAIAGGWKPARLAAVLQQAAQLENVRIFFSLAEEIEERDANYRSVISTRKQTVAALPWHVEPFSKSARDVEVAKFVEQQLNLPTVRAALELIQDAVSKGISITEIIWKFEGGKWCVDRLEPRPMRHFMFSKVDGKTPLLMNTTVGETPQPLDPDKYIVHTPQLKAGLPIKSGLALVAAWVYVLKQLTLRDWAYISETNGKPSYVGIYSTGKGDVPVTPPEDIEMLRRTVAGLSPAFSAVLPDTTEVKEITAKAASSVEIHERFCRYLDEQVNKLALGASLSSGTSATGHAGGQSLGKVHNELRIDIARNDAQALCMTTIRDLVRPLVHINFGPDTPLPYVSMPVKEGENLKELAEVSQIFAGIGVPLSKTGLASRANLPLATSPEDAVIVPTKAQDVQQQRTDKIENVSANSAIGGKTAAFSLTGEDNIDSLVSAMETEFGSASAELQAQMRAALAGAKSVDDLKARLAAFVLEADTTRLQQIILSARTKTRAAGETGTDL